MPYYKSKGEKVTKIVIAGNDILTINPESEWTINSVIYPENTPSEKMSELIIILKKEPLKPKEEVNDAEIGN